MKSLRQEYIQNNINICLNLNKSQKYLIIIFKPFKSEEYLTFIKFQKDYFQKNSPIINNINKDISFCLHLGHNYPVNPPKLFCLTLLTDLGIEIGDGRDILEEVIESSWNIELKLSPKEIILKIPYFIEKCIEEKNNIFKGKYTLNYEYNYDMLLKVPHLTLNIVEQIINSKTGFKEKRFIMITSLFFMMFSYKEGYFSYNEVKLIFWASIFSIYGIKKDDLLFEFWFFKNGKQKINLCLNINEGNHILNILFYIFQKRGIDYLLKSDEKDKNVGNINIMNNKIIFGDKNGLKEENKNNEK